MAVVTTTPFVRRLVQYWFLSMATVSMAMACAAVWFEETLATDENTEPRIAEVRSHLG